MAFFIVRVKKRNGFQGSGYEFEGSRNSSKLIGDTEITEELDPRKNRSPRPSIIFATRPIGALKKATTEEAKLANRSERKKRKKKESAQTETHFKPRNWQICGNPQPKSLARKEKSKKKEVKRLL